MSTLAGNTYANPSTPFYAAAGESARNWYQFPSLNGTILLADAAGIQTLQAIGNDLFYNGELLAKAGDIQDIAAWSDYPAINNVNMDGFSLLDVSGLVINNGATMGSLLVSNGITSEANITTPSIQVAGAAIPNLGQITTITLAATGQVQAGSLVAGAIQGTTISGSSLSTSGGLDMANTGITRAASVGISNAGAAPYGSLTSPDGVMLTWNGQSITTGAGGNVSQWANYPAVAAVNANTNDITNAGTVNAANVSIGGGSTGNLLTSRITSLAGATDPALRVTAYQGLSVTADAGNITTTAGAVSGTGNISTTARGVIADTAYGETHTITNNFEVTCDGGLNPLTTPNINLVAQNGNGGQINLSANPGSVAALGGAINITANGGTVILPTDPPTSVTVGGEINIKANTGSGGLYTLTSAVNIAAAGVNSYAGAIPPVGSLAGYNFIYGTTGVSICSGLPASGFQLPGTTYIYGFGSPGFTGVRLQSPYGIGLLSDTYATNLYPLDGNNLTIQGRSAPDANVTILDCDSLTMTGTGAGIETDKLNSVSGNSILCLDSLRANGTTQGIYTNFIKPPEATAPGVPNLTISGNGFGGNANYVNLANVNTLSFDSTGTGAITNLQSINGAAWPPPTGDASLWSQYPATSVIDVSGYGLTRVGDLSGVVSINGVPYAPTSAADWSLYPAIHAVDISNQELLNVNNIGFLDNGTIIGAGQLSVLASGNLTLASDNSGNVNIGTGNKGDINITTGGTGNDVTIGGDTIRLTGTVAVDVNSTLNMTANNITNLSQVINSTSGLTLTTFGNVETTSTSGSIISTASVNNDIIATNGAVNITANTQIDVSAPTINLNAVTINANAALTASSVSTPGDVVSSSGTNNYSLNTVGALVSGNQQYDYWVAVNGSDSTGTGSAIRPFASVTAALAATLSISDALPINIRLTAGTYTENPTVTRNNTFLVGNVGVADAVIIGTVTFDPTATATVSQGMSGITVVGSLVCNDTISFDINWYIQFCNITSYTVAAINAVSTGSGNNSLILNNTVVTQNVTTNTAIVLNSVRLNAIQAQINNTTTGACVSANGTASMSLFGCVLTAAGAATASALVTYINAVSNGTASSFSLNTFTYTAATAGAAKAAFFFNNAGGLAGATTINNNVFALPGAAALIQRPGAGSIAIAFGANTTSIQTIPAAGAGLTYTYTTSTPLSATALYDQTGSAGTNLQVLGCGAGGGLQWRSLTNTSLGTIPQAASTSAYLNQPLFYNTTTGAINYIASADDVTVQPCPATYSPIANNKSTTFILTSTGASTFTLNNNAGTPLTANDVGWYMYVKNGNGTNGGDITINGALVSGNTVVHNQTAVQNGQIVIVRWTGTAFVVY
jgi:hypothetical protein